MLELSYWVNTIKCGIFLCAISPNHQPTHPLSRCVSTTPTGRHIHPRTLPSGRQSTLQWVRRMPVALHTKPAQLPYVAKGNKLKKQGSFYTTTSTVAMAAFGVNHSKLGRAWT